MCKCNGECGKVRFGCGGYTTLVARVLLALLFIVAGVEKVMGFSNVVGYIASAGLPMPQVLAVLTVIIEIGAGLMLVLGFRARKAAWILVVFTALATAIFHNHITDQLQQTMALKNLAIIGGLLMVAVYGPGKFSLRCKCGNAKCPDCGDKCKCDEKGAATEQKQTL